MQNSGKKQQVKAVSYHYFYLDCPKAWRALEAINVS